MSATPITLNQIYETPPDGDYFFGYYDKSPLNADNNRLLAQRTPFINRMPEAGEAIAIGYFEFPGGRDFTPIAETRSWNWQQGSMLQWLGPDFSSRVLYNDIRDGHYRAIVLDIATGAETVLPMPAYTITSDGQYALSIDYDRLFWYRPGYNYQGTPRLEKKKPFDPEDGIWRMSLADGSFERIIAIGDVMKIGRVSSMYAGVHYLEHMMINPANSRFVFLHRWLNVDGGIYARMLTADTDGRNLFMLNDSGRMSHYCWRDDRTVFGYGGTSTTLNKLRGQKTIAKNLIKPLLPLYHKLFPPGGAISRKVTGDCFQSFTDQTGDRDRIDRSILPEDGHPTFCPGSTTTIINDTYPDEEGNCRLYLFDVEQRKPLDEVIIASDSAVRATGYRADLHPKWSYDGRHVCVDTCTKRGRGMSVFSLW